MTRLYVNVHDEQGRPINQVSVAWTVQGQEAERAGVFERENARSRLDGVPDSGAFTVHIVRRGAPDLWVMLSLGVAGDRRFPRGRPSVMQLVRARAGSRYTDYTLDLTWYPPQEVVICAGKDIHHGWASVFPGISVRRFARMVKQRPGAPANGIMEVNRSCVLTLFEFNGNNSRIHHLLPGRGTVDVPGYRQTGPAVLMKSVVPAGGSLSITNLYGYLESIGRDPDRRGTVMALEFASHAYWIGPILENTDRGATIDLCRELCPVHAAHRGAVMVMPRQMPLARFSPAQSICHPNAPIVNDTPLPGASDHTRRDRSRDRDPRNTDFSPGIMPDASLRDTRAAFHQNALLRVWGCNNGDMGPRLRAAMPLLSGSANEYLTINSHKAGSHPYRQMWKIRRGDLRFLYYSLAHRSYAQAIASAMQHPCYAAVPGTWSWYIASQRLGGMTVNGTTVARVRSFIQSLPNFNDKDEAGYYRFEPNITRYDVPIKVLVTGFVPFRRRGEVFARINAAERAVSNFPNIYQTVRRPPWINLSLTVQAEASVDVVWTCPASLVPVAGVPPRPGWLRASLGGGADILRIARSIDADIVVMVGGSENVRGLGYDLRVEQFARNYGMGADTHADNNGQRLAQTGELFPGKPGTLESTVPRLTWAYIVKNLEQAGLRVHIPQGGRNIGSQPYTLLNSAGDFICNETFYGLLLEAKLGGDRRSPPSGRWVCFVHIAALNEADDAARQSQQVQTAARGLGIVVQTLVEEMMWAREPYGLVDPRRPDAIPCTP